MQKRTVLSLVVAVIAMGLLWGCEEEGLSGTRKGRLIALENAQLKKDLEQCEKEIEECLQQKKTAGEQMKREVQEIADNAIKDFEEIVTLREENEKLKARIAELEEQLSSQ